MKDIKLIIDGKEIPLTEAQLTALTSDSIIKNPFRRPEKKQEYYYISCTGEIENDLDYRTEMDNAIFNNVNQFNDDVFAHQVALHQLLYRKLLKFAYDNGVIDTDKWDGTQQHCFIIYDIDRMQYTVSFSWKARTLDTVYFVSQEAACAALEEVVKPFVAQYPEFVL